MNAASVPGSKDWPDWSSEGMKKRQTHEEKTVVMWTGLSETAPQTQHTSYKE